MYAYSIEHILDYTRSIIIIDCKLREFVLYKLLLLLLILMTKMSTREKMRALFHTLLISF